MPVPQPVQKALTSHPPAPLSASLAASPHISLGGLSSTAPRPNRDSLQRKQLWWLPYVVLEFDKNEVLVDALGGDLANPVWMYSATFDVSRISDIAITAYLRTQAPKPASSAGEDDGTDMGNSDLALGAIRFTPDLETGRMLDEWVPIAGGTGSVHVQVAFKPAQVCGVVHRR